MIHKVSLRQIQSEWDHVFQTNIIQAPFFTWQWHINWFDTIGSNWQELILFIDNKIIAPFAYKNHEAIFSGGNEIADYLDIIGPDEYKITAWEQIISELKGLNFSKLILRNIPQSSPTRIFFEPQPNTMIQQEDTTPMLSLPNTWNSYIESLPKKYRHELERKIRKFDREYPDSQIVESQYPENDISILFNLMEKDEDKKQFLTPQMKTFFIKTVTSFPKNVTLRYISLGDKNIAATLTFHMNNIQYLYNSGFDKQCCSIAGFYLKAKNIGYAIEQNISTYNFLQGNERYKYELGGNDFFVYTITYHIEQHL